MRNKNSCENIIKHWVYWRVEKGTLFLEGKTKVKKKAHGWEYGVGCGGVCYVSVGVVGCAACSPSKTEGVRVGDKGTQAHELTDAGSGSVQ